MTDLPKGVGETKSEPIQPASFYAKIANAVAMHVILKRVEKQVMNAATKGRFSVKVGYLPLEIADHLNRCGFAYSENSDNSEESFLHF